MRGLGAFRRWSGVVLLVFSAFALAGPTMAQVGTSPPLGATLFLRNPPPGGIFSPTTPITIVLQIQNVSGFPVNTTDGFSTTEFWRRLFFTLPEGGTVTNTAEARIHRDARVFHCLSRGRALQRPTAIPVVPVEVLAGPPTPFFLEYVIDDARRFYDLTRTGRYTVEARIPLLTFVTGDPNAVITDCDQFEGQTVVNVSAVTGRRPFTIVSNSLEFVITQYSFIGFGTPLINDSACAAPACKTFKLNSTVPVKFQLFDENNAVVGTAVIHIAVAWVSGTAPLQTPEDLGTGAADTGNQFRFDPASNQYIFNLNTKVLTPGVWRIDAILDDKSVRSVHIGLR